MTPEYRKLLDDIVEVAVRSTGEENKMDALMLLCDISAEGLLQLFPDADERLVALGTFTIRFGSRINGELQ